MQIGIFAKTFTRPTLEGVLDAVVAHGLYDVQFNMACAGLPSMPDAIEDSTAEAIHAALAARSMRMAALSGTFNMIHPDPQQRQTGLRRLAVLAAACSQLGTQIMTLCTGSRDPDNMWRWHPDNDSPEAWRDLTESVRAALQITEPYGVTLGVEPEVTNVVHIARKARQLLNEMQSPRLKIIMDGSNLFHKGELPRMRAILDEAFELLGADIVLAHAKDLNRDGEAGQEAAGTGMLDYDHYLGLLHAAHYDGPLILHSLREDQVAASVAFLRQKLNT
jgi:sugar phosphate isomerase/epimerase